MEEEKAVRLIKLRLNTYIRLRELRDVLGKRGFTHTVEYLLDLIDMFRSIGVRPIDIMDFVKKMIEERKKTARIIVSSEELEKALNAYESPTIIDGKDAFIIVVSRNTGIYDSTGRPTRIQFEIMIPHGNMIIFIVRKDKLRDKSLFFVKNDETVGVAFNDKHRMVFLGRMTETTTDPSSIG